MSDGINKIITNVRTYLLWGLLFSLIIVPLVVAFTYLALHEGDDSRPYVPELRKIADQTPLYPGFQRTGEKVVLKNGKASFSIYYKADARLSDVEAFYRHELPSRGWTPPQPPSTSFFETDPYREHYRRGDYFIAIYRDSREPHDFSIVFIWAPQSH